MSLISAHSAVGPALGYYYQAVYALHLLLQNGEPDAYESIESWDDVVLQQGSVRVLHQLKHTIDLQKTITIKNSGLWRTLTIWLDYSKAQGTSNSYFCFATVAKLPSGSLLECLRDPQADRTALQVALTKEAMRVQADRDEAKKLGKPQSDWPHAERSKDCERYLSATEAERDALLNHSSLMPGSFSMSHASPAIENILSKFCPSNILKELTKQLLAWWDREVVEALTHERTEPLRAENVRAFIVERAAILADKGYFEDTETYLAKIQLTAPGVKSQLDLIDATQSQRDRSANTDMAARAQRAAWMEADISKVEALRKYDAELIKEWRSRFDQTVDECDGKNDAEIKKYGRGLLDWSHFNAPQEVRRIDKKYDNPDLIRGSYIYLSGGGSVGWHINYLGLLQSSASTSKGPADE